MLIDHRRRESIQRYASVQLEEKWRSIVRNEDSGWKVRDGAAVTER